MNHRWLGTSLVALCLAAFACGESERLETSRVPHLAAHQVAYLKMRLRSGNAVGPEEATHDGNYGVPNPSPQSECDTFTSELGPGFKKSWISVPEDWESPSGTKIRVFYYSRPAASSVKSAVKTAVPVVFFNGGPASDSHSSYQILESLSAAKAVPLVYIDQRGTGCSDPFPTSLTEETARRLTHYGSRSIVQDAESIRTKLYGSGSRWKAFGQSFGGYIVSRYTETAPDGLAGAFAHGASIMSDSVQWLALRIRSQHRVLEDYFSVYPGDRAAITRIQAAISEQKCFEDGESRICGPAVIDGLTSLLGFRDSWQQLHDWLGSLDPVAGVVNRVVLDSFVRDYVFGVFAANGFAASVISQYELSPGLSDREACAQALNRLDAAGEHPSDWPIQECRLLAGLQSRYDSLLETLRVSDPVRLASLAASLDTHPALHFFLYSGRKDVFVPVETFSEETQQLGSRVTYREFPTSGHDGFYSEPQIWSDLLERSQ